MIAFLVMFYCWPIFLLADYAVFIRQLDPYQAELTKASHGVFMICAGIAFLRWDRNRILPPDIRFYATVAVIFLFGLGAFWLSLGAARTRWYRFDARFATRAAVKIAVGVALYLIRNWSEFEDYQPFAWAVLCVVGPFCIITGITRLWLVLRGVREPRIPAAGSPYGAAPFADGDNLQ